MDITAAGIKIEMMCFYDDTEECLWHKKMSFAWEEYNTVVYYLC